jgi:Carboxypeptidase regulatory-like domain
MTMTAKHGDQVVRAHVARALAGAMIMIALPTFGYGFCPQPPPKVCNEFFRSDVVLVGVVESERAVQDKDGEIEGWFYSVGVRRLFRGPSQDPVMVYTENASARLPLRVGREYLLFGTGIDSCGHSGLASESADSIRAIERLPKSATTVEGVVTSNASTAVAGLRFRVQSDSGMAYSAITNSVGAFRVEVPPGRYSVVSEASTVVPFDISVDDPSGFALERGQCGQVAFVKNR